MNTRTIYLLVGAGFVGLLYFGDQAYRTYIEKPASTREKNLKKVDDAIEKANDLIAQKLSVQKQLDAYERMSLPFDTEVTRTKYQGWLLSTVKSIGFTGTSVDAAQPVTMTIKRQKPKKGQSARKPVLYRYSYTLRCRGSLRQLVTFLYRFYRSGHLHKIRSISLNPSGGGATIDTSMNIEALSLLRTDRESELSSVLVNRLKDSDEQHYVSIARRNIFSRTGDTILNKVRVTAITFDKNGRPQVWIKTDPTKPSMLFLNDEKFAVGSHQLEVLDIQSEVVLLLLDGAPVKVPLGRAIVEKDESAQPEDSTSVAANKTETVD